VKHAPDCGNIGCWEAVAQLVSDPLGAMGGVGLAMCQYSLTIRVSHYPASVLMRGRRAVGQLGSLNPATDGAAVHMKATCEFALGDAAMEEPLNLSSLCRGQSRLRVVLHRSPTFASVAPPAGVLT
jgi:hypothetical protein